MTRPRDLSDRLRELRKLEGVRETFMLPVNAARLKARQFLDGYPCYGCTTIVENWRQLPDASSNSRYDGC
jgi:hypothetical protein